MLPFWTNLLVRTYALMAVMRTEGYINDAFGLVGLGPFEMLHTNFAVIVGLVYVHLPFIILPLYSTLDRMDRSLIEASLDLGAGHIATIFKVVIPIAKPGILSAIMLTFIPALGSLPHAGPARRARQPDDRQRDRAPVQARQRLAVRRCAVVHADVPHAAGDGPARAPRSAPAGARTAGEA
jgi:hypothetical protein